MKRFTWISVGENAVLTPALTPLEAAVLPAGERRCYGALRHAREAFDRSPACTCEVHMSMQGVRRKNQRQKI